MGKETRSKKIDGETIAAALRENGLVASRLPSYEPRQAQIELLELIVRAFNEDAFMAAEAGTGVGKSFAYLLPAVYYAIANNERIVISTATINLQQQLFDKDIPLVAHALNMPVKAVLMKGRGNYICRRRLEDAVREPDMDEDETAEIHRIAKWADTSETGGKSELPFLPVENIWARICSESDTCLGRRCPNWERCFLTALRKEAMNARIIVVNHHLLFADLAARQGGAGYEVMVALPPFSRVIVDEAHTIENAASSFFSREFSRPGLLRQLGRLYSKRRNRRRGLLVRLGALLPGSEGVDAAIDALDVVRAAIAKLDEPALELCGLESVFRLSPRHDNSGARRALFPALADLREKILCLTAGCKKLLEKMASEHEDNPVIWEIKPILRYLDGVAGICAAFPEYREKQNEVMWIETRTQEGSKPWAVFSQSPVDVAENLRDSLFKPNKTVVCVSATLTVNGSFAYWAGRCGLYLAAGEKFLSGCFPSPFPYDKSVFFAVPTDAPLPDEADFQGFVDRAAGELAASAGGSALILFTSYQSMRSAYSAAFPVLESLGIRCLKQGDDDRARLLRTFLDDTTSVLFATDSFWEGVDAPGDTLRLVIICRLPFRSPNDPVFEARREAIEKNGGNPFTALSLPEAVMKFKQGFGRLMRKSSDRGVVVVLDGRLVKKQYGAFFLNSLPETKTAFTGFSGIVRGMENFLYS
ncbi:MAG TPA: ATP-dependent DNA helicase DinG [Treponema sp.]|nr:ATP-dependent DNA helicase DinG [Treponema sp.]